MKYLALSPISTLILAGIAFVLTTGAILAAQPTLPPGAALDATLNALSTQVSGLEARVERLESSPVVQPSATVTPTATRTPTATNTQAIPFTPTIEEATSLTATALTHLPSTQTPTRTITPTPHGSVTATLLPVLDINLTCTVIAAVNLTKRADGSPNAQSLGTLTAGAIVRIAPYKGKISGIYWYVPVIENGQTAYYVLYGYIEAGVIRETFLSTHDEAVFCQPAVVR